MQALSLFQDGRERVKRRVVGLVIGFCFLFRENDRECDAVYVHVEVSVAVELCVETEECLCILKEQAHIC